MIGVIFEDSTRSNEKGLYRSKNSLLDIDDAYRARETMVSNKEYLDCVLNRLVGLDDVTYRSMMGEFIIYYRGKVIGGIYDDRLLLKPTKSSKELMPNAVYRIPYEGAKEMLLFDDIDNRELLQKLIQTMYPELPDPKSKKRA